MKYTGVQTAPLDGSGGCPAWMARVSKRFVDEVLWPEYEELSRTLQAYLSEVTDRVVNEVLHADATDAEVEPEPPRGLPRGG